MIETGRYFEDKGRIGRQCSEKGQQRKRHGATRAVFPVSLGMNDIYRGFEG